MGAQFLSRVDQSERRQQKPPPATCPAWIRGPFGFRIAKRARLAKGPEDAGRLRAPLSAARYIRGRIADATILVNGSYLPFWTSGSSPPNSAAHAIPRVIW